MWENSLLELFSQCQSLSFTLSLVGFVYHHRVQGCMFMVAVHLAGALAFPKVWLQWYMSFAFMPLLWLSFDAWMHSLHPGVSPEFSYRRGHMAPTNNTWIAHQKWNFKFYYAVVKFRLLEKYGKKQRKKRIMYLVNVLLLKMKNKNLKSIIIPFNWMIVYEEINNNLLTHCRVSSSLVCSRLIKF